MHINSKKIYLFVILLNTLSSTAFAAIHTETVTYRVGDTALQGYLAYDDTVSTKRPAILIFHEWWGITDYTRSRAEQLASLGYVAFVADLYGTDKATTHPEQAREWSSSLFQNALGRTRATAALKLLREQPNADPNRIAAIGYCLGGTIALDLAYSGADLRGAVSFHSSLPFPSPDESPNIKAKLLICHGANDDFLTKEKIQSFTDALRESGADWQMIFYSNARHSFTNPHCGQYNLDGVAYNPAADRRSWRHLQSFFKEIFKK
jgi:dienelactone hydrolase